jgi:hypothetical protein
MRKNLIKTLGEAVPLKSLTWMEEFQFSDTGAICQKTALLYGENIGYIDRCSNIQYAAPDTMVLPVKIKFEA